MISFAKPLFWQHTEIPGFSNGSAHHLRLEVHAAKAALEVRAGAVERWDLGECGRWRARWEILNVTAAGRSEP